MGFFDSSNPEQRQEQEFKQMIALLTQIRDLLQKSIEPNENEIQ